MSDFKTIRAEIADNVLTLTLARPDKLNALTPTVFAELGEAIDSGLALGARAIVLTGEGRGFCAGADLMPDAYGYQGLPDDVGEVLDQSYNPFVRKIAALDVPFLTAVNGVAAGAGCGLALLGDIVVMSREAYMLLAFVNIGLVPDAGSTWLVTKAVGRAKALEMAMLGEKLTADQALSAGLVTRVADDALHEARDLAIRMAAGPTVAIGMIRKQIAAALTASLEDTLAIERTNQSRAGYTADFKEAVAAFGEKRPPRFEGR